MNDIQRSYPTIGKTHLIGCPVDEPFGNKDDDDHQFPLETSPEALGQDTDMIHKGPANDTAAARTRSPWTTGFTICALPIPTAAFCCLAMGANHRSPSLSTLSTLAQKNPHTCVGSSPMSLGGMKVPKSCELFPLPHAFSSH